MNKIKMDSDKVGAIMDLEDVKEELIALKDFFEKIQETSDENKTKYKASYSAVALAEACNLINHYLKNQEKEN